MTTLAEAIDALNFDLTFTVNGVPNSIDDPLNEDSDTDPAYVFDYQFETSQPGDLWNSYSGWTALTAAEKNEFRDALAYVETLINVDFSEVSGMSDPTMNVGKVSLSSGTAGIGGYQYNVASSGGPWYLSDWDNFTVFTNASSLVGKQHLILHEIGHALGLKHPFSGSPTLPASLDNNKYTIMSYDPNPDNGLDNEGYLAYDIAALQQRWGANLSTATGDDTYTGPRNNTVDVIWDAGGIDALDASAETGAVTLDLKEGAFSRFGSFDDVQIAYGVVIEKAFGGSGDDTLNGSGNNDTLDGNAGADEISGLFGNDDIYGGIGGDSISGGGGADSISGEGGFDYIDGDSGNDTISGGPQNDTLFGGNAADVIWGGDGNDILYGEGFTDTLNGDADNDTLYGGGSSDTLNGGAGDDSLEGNNAKDFLFGDSGSDELNGGAGNDELDGGTGADTLLGSTGNDSLTGGAGTDVFLFRANHGTFDQILDFADGTDMIRFDINALNDVSDLTITDVSTGAKVDYGTGSIRVLGVDAADLTSADFDFV